MSRQLPLRFRCPDITIVLDAYHGVLELILSSEESQVRVPICILECAGIAIWFPGT